jgi:hypothetical protein
MSFLSDLPSARVAADWCRVAGMACAVASLAFAAGNLAIGDYYLASAVNALTIASEVWAASESEDPSC